ncbi:MAG: YgiT-type zinc finger protein [Candidatus Omnitrophica bacterium]|nr:YgiT-type zinc finger protein [Candidatus Omnitrophota bacterium]MBU0878409.1 YgiT-type zinc finger protein [Candidatus Omnitrophota bacterium]MBU1523323.1 YgiT-type zinc finger protein [Candidatus Omnitrophota bacterium]
MKCVVCKGPNIVTREVEEEVRVKNDVILVPVEVMICEQCGERYYDRATMKKLEEINKSIRENKRELEEIGHVLKVSA